MSVTGLKIPYIYIIFYEDETFICAVGYLNWFKY